jgi:hypothetical protein
VKQVIVLLFLLLVIEGCSPPKVKKLADKLKVDQNTPLCIVQMPYSMASDSPPLYFNASQGHQFGRGMTQSLNQNIGKKLTVHLRQAISYVRPSICGSSETGFVPAHYDYVKCLMKWIKASLKADHNFCPYRTKILLTGATVYRYLGQGMSIDVFIKTYEEDSMPVRGDRLIASRELKAAAERKDFHLVGRIAGSELARLINKGDWR